MSQVTTRSQARQRDQKGVDENEELDQYELDRRAASGETLVKGGAGGLSYEAQQHLAAGRKAGGETRKHQITHEGYHNLGQKGHPVKSDDAEEDK
ncbi:unnamed protein product [Calypogeia fissa]